MAKFSPILGSVRGSLAGCTFTRCRGGNMVTVRKVPTNRQSSRQLRVRAAFADVAVAWNGLSDAQRAQWKDYAKSRPRVNALGTEYTMTGQQAFISLMTVWSDSGEVIKKEPPAQGRRNPPGPGAIFILEFHQPGTIWTNDVVAPGIGGRHVLWWSGPINSARDPGLSRAAIVAYSERNPVGLVEWVLPFEVQAGSTAKFWLGNVDQFGQLSELVSRKARWDPV
ncbi:unnamed protein product [marine sediment metagenome]|uniref:Uncharacterized protein n=1 Tax=marine sediment metagenome TaxID=412755 RepID=X1HLR7_9ZZZZ